MTASKREHADVTIAPQHVLLPGLVDSHVHVNEPGRTEWEGFATRDRRGRAPAASPRSSTCRSTASRRPPSVAALRRQAGARPAGKVHVDIAFWGGAVPGNARRARAAARGRRGRLQVLPAAVRRGRVPTARRGRPAGGDGDASRRSTALLIAHAEAERRDRRRRGPSYRGFVESRPPAAETACDRRPDRGGARDRLPRARRPPVRGGRAAADRGRRRRTACRSPSRPARTT